MTSGSLDITAICFYDRPLECASFLYQRGIKRNTSSKELGRRGTTGNSPSRINASGFVGMKITSSNKPVPTVYIV